MTCSVCGDKEIWAKDIQVRICVETGESSYVLRCPTCSGIQVRASDESVDIILISAGARIDYWHRPAELDEEHIGPVIGVDDLIDFHELLDDPNALWEDISRNGPTPY